MRKTATLLVTSLLVAGLGAIAAVPAGASVADAGGKKPSKFCKAVKKFDVGDIGNPTTKKGAAKTVKQLEKLRRSTKGDTRDALDELVDAYEQVADGESAREAFGNRDFVSAAATFAVEVGKCFVNDLPDITLPDITLPDITLPDLDR